MLTVESASCLTVTPLLSSSMLSLKLLDLFLPANTPPSEEEGRCVDKWTLVPSTLTEGSDFDAGSKGTVISLILVQVVALMGGELGLLKGSVLACNTGSFSDMVSYE